MGDLHNTQAPDPTHALLIAIGKRVRHIRRALRLTQAELSTQVGVARSTIIELEQGQRKHLNITLLQKIAAVTNSTIAQLTDGALAAGTEQPGIASPTLERVVAHIAALPVAKQEQMGRVLEPLIELVRTNPE